MKSQSATWSLTARSLRLWSILIRPHPAVEDPVERRRAQLLAIVSLVLTVLLVGALVSGPASYDIFFELGGITLFSYGLSKTRYYRVGTYLFCYTFTALGFFRIYQGTASTIDSSITTTVYIAIIVSSALLSQRGFLILASLATLATFATPTYSAVAITAVDNIPRTGGVVLALGMLLYGINIFRSNLEKTQLKELQEANRDLGDVMSTLERRVAERTRELEEANVQTERRVERWQTITEISHSISSNMDRGLDELLSFIARSISERTAFYHVGIFLLDQTRQYAVLRAANSPGGIRMLERHHQLKVGGVGIVGYVAQAGRPRIALDTGLDAVFFNNPDLPETRSEMTLPLKTGPQVIGALDLQSTQQSAFTEEDLTALSALANQIAIIVLNSQLREGGETAPSGMLTGRQVRPLGAKDQTSGFSYLPDGTISSAVKIAEEVTRKALDTGDIVATDQNTRSPSLAVPVKIRDRVVGIIHLETTDEKRRWTEDDIALVQAVSERAALAIENASLFEATERRARQEQVVAEVTTRIGESNNMERILKTTIQELGRTLGATRTYIQLGTRPIPVGDED